MKGSEWGVPTTVHLSMGKRYVPLCGEPATTGGTVYVMPELVDRYVNRERYCADCREALRERR